MRLHLSRSGKKYTLARAYGQRAEKRDRTPRKIEKKKGRDIGQCSPSPLTPAVIVYTLAACNRIYTKLSRKPSAPRRSTLSLSFSLSLSLFYFPSLLPCLYFCPSVSLSDDIPPEPIAPSLSLPRDAPSPRPPLLLFHSRRMSFTNRSKAFITSHESPRSGD